MTTNSEEIVVRFRTEGGHEVEETFRRTADASEHFHSKITKAGESLENLRLKSEARVAHNIGNVAQSMISGASAGDVLAQAITSVTESFRGSILFAAGAGVGASLYQGITKAGESIINLETEIKNLRTEASLPGDFLGADRVNKNLDITLGRISQLQGYQKQASFFTGLGQTGGGAAQAIPFLGPLLGNIGSVAPLINRLIGGEISKERENARRELSQISDIQTTINQSEKESLSGNEELSVQYKIQADSKARAFAISERAAKAGVSQSKETKDALAAEGQYEQILLDQNSKQFSIKQTQLDLQTAIIRAEGQFADASSTSLKILNLKIAALDKILKGTLSVQERQQTQNQRDETARQRGEFGRQTFQAGPYAFYAQAHNQQVSEYYYELMRRRFEQEETQRRLGGKDVRSPFLRGYEEAAFGPYQRPLTQEEATAQYYNRQNQTTQAYYQGIENQWSNYDELIGGWQTPTGKQIAPGTNVNTGEATVEQLQQLNNKVESIQQSMQSVGIM